MRSRRQTGSRERNEGRKTRRQEALRKGKQKRQEQGIENENGK